MRFLAILITLFFFASCAEKESATACAGVNKNLSATDGMSKTSAASTNDAVFFKRRKRAAKAEDGFRKKNRTPRAYGEKAEKGKKKETSSKAERKWRLFKRKRAADKATAAEDKKLFHVNREKRQKEIRKKAKNPEMGLFPKKMRR